MCKNISVNVAISGSFSTLHGCFYLCTMPIICSILFVRLAKLSVIRETILREDRDLKEPEEGVDRSDNSKSNTGNSTNLEKDITGKAGKE